MQKILQTVNKFAIDTTKVFVLALKVICRDIILPMLISFQNCSMPAAAGLQQRSLAYSKPICTAWRVSASAPTNMTGSLAAGVPQNKTVIYSFLQKVYDSVIDWTIVGCVYTGVSCPELLLAAWLRHARIIGWGIRFKLQMLCPQEDE